MQHTTEQIAHRVNIEPNASTLCISTLWCGCMVAFFLSTLRACVEAGGEAAGTFSVADFGQKDKNIRKTKEKHQGNHKKPSGKTLRNHCRAIGKPYSNHMGAIAKRTGNPQQNHGETIVNILQNIAEPIGQPQDDQRKSIAKIRDNVQEISNTNKWKKI